MCDTILGMPFCYDDVMYADGMSSTVEDIGNARRTVIAHVPMEDTSAVVSYLNFFPENRENSAQ